MTMMQKDIVEEVKDTPGLTPEKQFRRADLTENITAESSSGKKVIVHRFIDKHEMIQSLEEIKRQKAQFRAFMRANKMKRLLQNHSAQSQGHSKNSEKVQQQGKRLVDEIERLLIEKHSMKLKKLAQIDEKEAVETISQQALVDNIVMENKNYTKSLALKKRRWTGDEGAFEKKDLQEWFKVFNQTQLNKTKKRLKKLQKENYAKMQIGLNIKKIKLNGDDNEQDIEFDSPRFGKRELEAVIEEQEDEP